MSTLCINPQHKMRSDTLLSPADAHRTIDEEALDQLFRAARTHKGWLDRPVPEALLRQAVDLAKMGPTSANTLPMRIVFVKSAEAKARLKPALAPGNDRRLRSRLPGSAAQTVSPSRRPDLVCG